MSESTSKKSLQVQTKKCNKCIICKLGKYSTDVLFLRELGVAAGMLVIIHDQLESGNNREGFQEYLQSYYIFALENIMQLLKNLESSISKDLEKVIKDEYKEVIGSFNKLLKEIKDD